MPHSAHMSESLEEPSEQLQQRVIYDLVLRQLHDSRKKRPHLTGQQSDFMLDEDPSPYRMEFFGEGEADQIDMEPDEDEVGALPNTLSQLI